MIEPAPKAPEVDEALRRVFRVDRQEAIREGRCVDAPIGCGERVSFELYDQVTKSEFRISGLCRECQKKLFGDTPDAE